MRELFDRAMALSFDDRRAFIEANTPTNDPLRPELVAMVEAGDIRPIVGGRFSLEQAGAALRTIDERRATGKIVLDVRAP